MNWCKLTGHKWDYYNKKVSHMTTGDIIIEISKGFRYCAKCNTNQIRKGRSGVEKADWRNCELNIEQLREGKLKELGI
jgi:hypothetical protein